MPYPASVPVRVAQCPDSIRISLKGVHLDKSQVQAGEESSELVVKLALDPLVTGLAKRSDKLFESPLSPVAPHEVYEVNTIAIVPLHQVSEIQIGEKHFLEGLAHQEGGDEAKTGGLTDAVEIAYRQTKLSYYESACAQIR